MFLGRYYEFKDKDYKIFLLLLFSKENENKRIHTIGVNDVERGEDIRLAVTKKTFLTLETPAKKGESDFLELIDESLQCWRKRV